MAERISFDKPYDLRGEITPRVVTNIDEMLGQLYWSVAQLENKLSGGQGLLSSQNTNILQEQNALGSVTRWLSGPWTLDNIGGTDRVAGIVAAPVSTGTYNDFSPTGIDKAVSLEIEPSGGTVTLTGLDSSALYQRRFLFFRNRDSSNNVVLKHLNSGSLGRNQFRLPSDTDVTLGPRQAIWLFFDPAAGLWFAAVTPHASGGLSTGGGVLYLTRALSETEIESANSSPIQIIDAPGAGKAVMPIAVQYTFVITVGYGTNPTVALVYDGDTSSLVGNASVTFSTTGTKYRSRIMTANSFDLASFDIANKAVDMSLSANLGTGSVTGRVSVAYSIVDLAS